MATLDPLLHQPLRTQIAAYLAGSGEASFSELKRHIQVSDGNLDAHIKKLIAADYITTRKDASTGRTQTCYALTASGQQALQHYIHTLQQLLTPEPSGNHWQASAKPA